MQALFLAVLTVLVAVLYRRGLFKAPPETWLWDLRRDGIPRYYLLRPTEAFTRWGKDAAMRAWLEISEPEYRNRRVYPPADWEWRRIAVRDRDGARCAVCGRPDRPHDSLHTHHRHAYGDGGSHKLNNLVLLCGDCHAEEHRRLERGWRGRFFPVR